LFLEVLSWEEIHFSLSRYLAVLYCIFIRRISLQNGLKMMAMQRIWLCEQEDSEILACHFIKNPEALVASKSSS